MAYDEKVLMKYGSTKQKSKLRSKMAYDKTMSEVEWRKQAVQGWSALLKHAELGMNTYAPNDHMVICTLGENCFKSFQEYKEMKVKTAHGFNDLAKAMIAMNQSIVNKMTKVAGVIVEKGVDGLTVPKSTGMIKKASKKYMDGKDVAFVIDKIATKNKSSEWKKVASDIKGISKVAVSDVKVLFAINEDLKQGLKRIVK